MKLKVESISYPEISFGLKFTLIIGLHEGQLQVILSMFLNFDKDSGLCSYEIGSYPFIILKDTHGQ